MKPKKNVIRFFFIKVIFPKNEPSAIVKYQSFPMDSDSPRTRFNKGKLWHVFITKHSFFLMAVI